MDIQTVKDDTYVYQVSLTDGLVLWVPKDPLNMDYVRVQAWIAGGGILS